MILNSLYVHIPFCIHRCGYCDFNTYAGLEELIPAYSKAVSREIEYLSQSVTELLPIHTIYFGGGTPSLVKENELEDILNTIKNQFYLIPSPEITLEANPGTVTEEYLNEVHSLGVNRISLGMQSADQNELTLLERLHTYEDVIRAVEWTRTVGINNLNLDLIFGLSDQALNSWMDSLEAALSLQPEHLSLYALTLEHGTPMQHKVEKGLLPEPNPDIAADMYDAASERLAEEGYIQYEISNWARVNDIGEPYSCKHNLQYWRNLPYLGVGAGAHGFINHYRTVDVSMPGAYINRMSNNSALPQGSMIFPRTPATKHMNSIDADTEVGETMMMGLRLVIEGVSNQEFQQRFGISLQERFGIQIERLIAFGLLEWNGKQDDRLRLTQKGHLLGNQVFKEFI
jgi:oxygen-independent coproporphyrinogen III oxidase